MLWVLQSNLYRERGYERLIEALDRLGCDRVFVKPIPFSLRLAPGDFDSPTAVDLDDIPEPEIDTSRSIMAMGSYSLAKVAHARGWAPGAFLDNTSYDAWSAGWGHSRLLNPGAWTGPFRDAKVVDVAFVRPLSDSKSFAGAVFNAKEFAAWQASVVDIGPDAYVDGDTEVLVAAPQVIYTETRFFVVDGQVVTGSQYKIGGRVVYDGNVDPGAEAFARECVADWVPSRAFVVDVALTPDGYRVVEVNCFNAAGFYECDLQKLVGACEAAFPERATLHPEERA